jgi:hypothetical protein
MLHIKVTKDTVIQDIKDVIGELNDILGELESPSILCVADLETTLQSTSVDLAQLSVRLSVLNSEGKL